MHLKEEVTNTIIIEKSKFITYLNHIDNEDDFRDYLASLKKKYYDASHVCSAFIAKNIKRSNDDGEPSGTAGAPMLNVLEKNNLTDTCAIVVRYFGGIKLGAGGLIRAYSSSVGETLKLATLVETYIYPKYSIITDYETGNKLKKLMDTHTFLLDTIYNEQVEYIFALEDLNIINKIKEITKGQEPILIGEVEIEKEIS